MTEKIKVRESAFKYDPTLREISLITDLRFVYRSDSFKLDSNQHGEENLIPIKNIKKEENKLEFSAESEGEEINFELTSKTALDNLFFDIIAGFNQIIDKSSVDLDRIELIFKNGLISAFYIYKNILKDDEYQLLDSLRVISEPDGLFLIKQKPFRKIKLSKIYLEDKTIICESEESEKYDFTLDVNDTVFKMISNIFSII
ncbi:hypothetical protein SAMN05421856_103479 [Chryseobacterium taichungense]|uniref:Uncharacterized protein n=1 Tax=Chryseobacterium taichungense TaxID=295069 RepID=A0A1H7YR62_9FLAO|nr:hypothetical protein [Chryseobacterium taichungense]SEM48465.1 hypothetical protein SAMN05421856_103479 [Chryseobacterium taichungense]